jgi:hypothetical protein
MRVKAYADLRNYLTHSGPGLDRGEASNQLIKKLSGLNDIAFTDEVIIESGFLNRVVADFQTVFDDVYKALKSSLPAS